MIGLEQTVVPLIGKDELGIESNALIVSFIASFGAVKAMLNLFADSMSVIWGRKRLLVLGWLFGIPFPFICYFAPDMFSY